jgi:aminoglycoside 6'-N-acetyltransferase I
MRRALWDDCPDAQQERKIEALFASDVDDAFFTERRRRRPLRFPGVALRSRANGCDATPVGYRMASDAELWNTVSHQAHAAPGYLETARPSSSRRSTR